MSKFENSTQKRRKSTYGYPAYPINSEIPFFLETFRISDFGFRISSKECPNLKVGYDLPCDFLQQLLMFINVKEARLP